ncbi:hypothetical protein GTV32_22945 [Gordonia sp. SID5947]|uniref:hypothetical protein n=1 Tax=Gordonia sp. SID5947 TaxID=2690315 RepID=UPI00136F52E2|nr:hypothetical protein [Gordonia sp. SID5947]MYR08993.1 hypothetical protein [Gordonia sp. SID5947]
MTGDPHNSAGGPPPEILRRGRGYDAEPPVTLRSQVLRRRPSVDTPESESIGTGDFPSTSSTDHTTSDPVTPADSGGRDEDADDASRPTRQRPAMSAEARRRRRTERQRRRRHERSAASGTVLAAGPTYDEHIPWSDIDDPLPGPDVEIDDTLYAIARDPQDPGQATAETDKAGRTWSRVPRHVVAVAARHKKPLMVLLAGAAVVAVLAAVVLGVLVGGNGGDGAPTDPAAALTAPDPTSDQVECPSRQDGARTTGRDPGNQTSGPNAIKAFNWGYYQWRSGTAARAVVSANGKVGTAIALQQWIDVLDPKLRYCLAITDQGNNVYDVEQTLIPSGGGDRQLIRQDVTVTEIGGKYWIAAIKSKE